MANTENQHRNTNLNADQTTDVTRSENRQAAAASREDAVPMGTASEDTGSRPSNDNKGNQNAGNPHQNETGSHQEGQYPQNNENNNLRDMEGAQNTQVAQGRVGKPGDKPE